MTAPYGNPPGVGPLRQGGVSVSGLPQTENNLPSKKSKIVAAQMPAVTLMRDLVEGDERVKAMGALYLPQEPGEDPAAYQNRLQRSVFTNFLGQAVEGMTGLVFSKDPVLGDDVPVEIRGVPESDTTTKTEGHWENIDNAGTHGDVFIRELFQDGITVGHDGILVDFPQTAGAQYRDEEMRGEIRPYWVPIRKEQIVSFRTIVVNGREIVTQLVLEECVMVEDGEFGEKEVTQYRVFRRDDVGNVTVQVQRITEDKKLVTVSAGSYPTQDEIPFSENKTSGRKAMFVSKPPLYDLGVLNKAHYQGDSDYKNSLHKTCVPLYVETGVDPDVEGQGPIIIGPNTARRFTNPQATAQYVSHDGAALGSVRQALEDIKSDMGTLGISMLAPQKRAAETATAKRIDEKATDSALGVSARGLQDCIERALYFHARYLKKASGGSIKINRSFDDTVMDAATMAAYGTLAQTLNIPVRVILEELQAGGRFVGQDLDKLEEAIEHETAAKLELARVESENRADELNQQGGKPMGKVA